MTDQPRSRRRLDTEERRAAILSAATHLFAAASYGQVSIAQIAEKSNSSQALVFHYFSNKAGLYTAVVAESIRQLDDAHATAMSCLDDGVSTRNRVRVSLLVYLDHIATQPGAWSSPVGGIEEPAEAQTIRAEARARYVAYLAQLLGVDSWLRHIYAVHGYFGFIDAACLHWICLGCPENHRHSIVDAALGGLEGALGDWRT